MLEIKKRIKAIALYKKHVIWTAIPVIIIAVLLSACTAGKAVPDDKNDTQALDVQSAGIQLAEEVHLNADGSFRLAQYDVELTGDSAKEKIVFDVVFSEELQEDHTVITNQVLWENLWQDTEVFVRILQVNDTIVQNTVPDEVILDEYNFSKEYSRSENLAVVKVDGQKYILQFGNSFEQGSGVFGYELRQIMPYGSETVLVDEKKASYVEPTTGENSETVINEVLEVAEKLDEYLKGSGNQMLLSISEVPDNCYLYGSQNGLYDKGRRQSAFNVFMTEVEGTGLELKLEDYFYPNGMKPLTKLPDDAKERILSGEILGMKIDRNHTTAGRMDLDGDGKEDVLFLEVLGPDYNGNGWSEWDKINSNFRIRVNEFYYENRGSNVDPVLMAFSPDGKQILLAVYDDGPSSDPLTSFYRYDKSGLHAAGQISADLHEISITDEGVMECTLRIDMIQTELVRAYYVWNGKEIIQREDEIYYYVDDSQWREQEQLPLMLLRKITVYEQRSESSSAIIMEPQEVRNIATDGVEWICLEGKDGTAGWIRVESGWFPSEEAATSELFDGLLLVD